MHVYDDGLFLEKRSHQKKACDSEDPPRFIQNTEWGTAAQGAHISEQETLCHPVLQIGATLHVFSKLIESSICGENSCVDDMLLSIHITWKRKGMPLQYKAETNSRSHDCDAEEDAL